MNQNIPTGKLVAGLLVAVGVGLFAYSMAMDVTVSSGTSLGRVVNIHLLARQKNFQNAGFLAAFLGVALAFLSGRGQPSSPSSGDAGSATVEESSLNKDFNPLNKMGNEGKQVFGLVFVALLVLAVLITVYRINNP